MTPGDLRSGTEGGSASLDFSKASLARLSDALLGGHDHYEVDREAMRRLLAIAPGARTMAKEHRDWLVRAVRFLAGKRGIDQFLDLGSGMPTAENTHQVAQSVAPDSRIVYVDNDPLVLVHAQTLLAVTPENATEYIDADLHDPRAILAAASRTTLDLSRPTGLILCNILGHVPDLDEAVSIVRTLMDRLPSGSYFVTADGTNVIDGPAFEEAIGVWNANAPLSYHLRRPDDLARFTEGLEVVEPGLVPCAQWRPSVEASPEDLRAVDEYGAVARKP